MRRLLAIAASATVIFCFGLSSVAIAMPKIEILLTDPVARPYSEDPCEGITCSDYDKDLKCSGSGKTALAAEVECLTDCVYLMPPVAGCCVCVSTGPDCTASSQPDANGQYNASGEAKNTCTKA